MSRALPQNETKLSKGYARPAAQTRNTPGRRRPARHDRALPVAVAQAESLTVAYLPGLAMRRIADLRPGEAKAGARDAAIIAKAARTMPHTLRGTRVADENMAELSMLCGYVDKLAKQAAATSNRIRGLLTQIHPGLETVIGPHLDHPAMLPLLAKYPTPKALRHAGNHRIVTMLRKQAPECGSGGRPRSSPHSTNKPSSCRAPTPPGSSYPS
ncbi:MAG: IS110 family transposase [Brevibacterium aurantiacum]|uniref:IS110 family transposase n=1 Tax=Brevibacterium aurantiacum TaxID=273384 RepID=UPI003F937488